MLKKTRVLRRKNPNEYQKVLDRWRQVQDIYYNGDEIAKSFALTDMTSIIYECVRKSAKKLLKGKNFTDEDGIDIVQDTVHDVLVRITGGNNVRGRKTKVKRPYVIENIVTVCYMATQTTIQAYERKYNRQFVSIDEPNQHLSTTKDFEDTENKLILNDFLRLFKKNTRYHRATFDYNEVGDLIVVQSPTLHDDKSKDITEEFKEYVKSL